MFKNLVSHGFRFGFQCFTFEQVARSRHEEFLYENLECFTVKYRSIYYKQ